MHSGVETFLVFFGIGAFIGIVIVFIRRLIRAFTAAKPASVNTTPARKPGFNWQRLAEKVHSEKVPTAQPYQAPRTPESEHSKWARPQEK